jgi:hypothetical protein
MNVTNVINKTIYHDEKLINEVSFIKNNPLFHEKQKTHLKSLKNEIEKMDMLKEILLSFGGSYVHFPDIEEDIDSILQNGQLWINDNKNIKLMKGRPSKCHHNSADLWYANKADNNAKVNIATGYALMEDGLWRQHSWLILVKPRKNKIIETTIIRTHYFGYALTDIEAEEFYSNHL